MATQTSTDFYAASAGLDVVAGVFGYLSSMNARSIARSRADLIRAEADANAQRYAEQATANNEQRKMMYLASGVTLSGSPIDVLDKQARIASENIAAIRMSGAVDALDQEQRGVTAGMQGRNALVGGFTKASELMSRALYQGFGGGVEDVPMVDFASAYGGGGGGGARAPWTLNEGVTG